MSKTMNERNIQQLSVTQRFVQFGVKFFRSEEHTSELQSP